MSDDLISRKAVENLISSKLTDGHLQMGDSPLIDADELMDDVSDLPTAYDVDKVVEKLEDEKSTVPVNRVLDDIINDKPKELGMLMAYRKAIEIVKGGDKE